MNQNIRSGSPAVNPARPKIRIGRSNADLQASSKTRVTARPPTRANQPRHHGTTAYTQTSVGTSASGATGSTLSHFFSSRPSHENPNLPTRTRDPFVIIFSPIAHPWPVRLALAHFFTNRRP